MGYTSYERQLAPDDNKQSDYNGMSGGQVPNFCQWVCMRKRVEPALLGQMVSLLLLLR